MGVPGKTIDQIPGFRRRFRVLPGVGSVTSQLEDDFHGMIVTLRHDGERIHAVEASMPRNPWTTCPGATEVVRATFTGASLAGAARTGDKRANCTHLYDLAVLAARHAGATAPLTYDMLVSDPVDGAIDCELRKDGVTLLSWRLRDGVIEGETEPGGRTLFELRDWIATLEGEAKEDARMLQWGSIMAHGRTMPLAERTDATKLPANCYTLQPENKAKATRIGREFDFSTAGRELLGEFPATGG